MNKPIVIYHACCPDGMTAAWVAWKFLKGECDLFPMHYGEPLPKNVLGRDIYVVDFSFDRPTMSMLGTMANRLVVLDHHKTAQANLEGLEQHLRLTEKANVSIEFDMNKSGARLAWEFFFPHERIPLLVEYCEDRDLWRWKAVKSQEINAAIGSYPFDIETWDAVSKMSFESLYTEGKAILRCQEKYIEAHLEFVREVVIVDPTGNGDSHRVPAINCSEKAIVSELLNRVCKGKPFAIGWNVLADGSYLYSVRSDANGIDVADFAKKFGGGGHQRAAGFKAKSLVFNL